MTKLDFRIRCKNYFSGVIKGYGKGNNGDFETLV